MARGFVGKLEVVLSFSELWLLGWWWVVALGRIGLLEVGDVD